jgi:hypothetical protein
MKISIKSCSQSIDSTFKKKDYIPEIFYSNLSSSVFFSDYGEILNLFHPSSRYFKECIIESITDLLFNNEVRTHYDIDSDDYRLEIISESVDKKTFNINFQLFSKLTSVKKKILIFETKFIVVLS